MAMSYSAGRKPSRSQIRPPSQAKVVRSGKLSNGAPIENRATSLSGKWGNRVRVGALVREFRTALDRGDVRVHA